MAASKTIETARKRELRGAETGTTDGTTVIAASKAVECGSQAGLVHTWAIMSYRSL